MTGHREATLAENGDAGELNTTLWPITDLETLEIISKWDTPEGGKWIVDYDILDTMLSVNNEDLTNKELQEIVDSVTYEATLERLGE